MKDDSRERTGDERGEQERTSTEVVVKIQEDEDDERRGRRH